ncbi:MAG: MBL fold metallo-hydrolase [Thermoplasmatales archaeon]
MDHYSGISELLWYRSIHRAEKPLVIFGPRGIKRNTEVLMRVLRTPKPWFKEQIDTNTTYIEDRGMDSIQVFRGRHLVPDNGYRIDYKGRKIFYSGDTAYSKDIVRGAEGADYLLHEMTYTDDEDKDARYWKHSTYSTTMRVFEESGAKRLIPVHLSAKSSALTLKLSKERKDILYPERAIKL